MAHHSRHNSAHKNQPPFEIVLDDSCSIICDDVPAKCTIRVMPVVDDDGSRIAQWVNDNDNDPPMSASGPHAAHEYPPPADDDDGYGPPARDRYGKIVGSPISPPSTSHPSRSRRSMVNSVRRNIRENSASSTNNHPACYDIFSFRRPWSSSPSTNASSPTEIALASSSSAAADRDLSESCSECRQPDPDPDRFILTGSRSQKLFKRGNIAVDSADLREMHLDAGSSSPPLSPSSSPTFPSERESPSPSPSPSSSHSPPPPPTRGTGRRCCAMADYYPADYGPKTPERDDAPGAGAGAGERERERGPCSYHGAQPCPVLAGVRCRQNPRQHGAGSAKGGDTPAALAGKRPSCKYHESLPCPVLAGIPCRGEKQMSGSSSPVVSGSTSLSEGSPSSPNSPSSPRQQRAMGPTPAIEQVTRTREVTPGRTREGEQAPKHIPPPPKNSSSRSPARSAPPKD